MRDAELVELRADLLEHLARPRVAVLREPLAEREPAAGGVERAAEVGPGARGLLEQLVALVEVRVGDALRLERGGLPDGVVQPVGQVGGLRRRLARLLHPAAERQDQRA